MRSRWLGVSMPSPIPSAALDAIAVPYSWLAASSNFYSFPEKTGAATEKLLDPRTRHGPTAWHGACSPIGRYSRKGGMAHHETHTLIGRSARRRPPRVRRAARRGGGRLHVQGHEVLPRLGV